MSRTHLALAVPAGLAAAVLLGACSSSGSSPAASSPAGGTTSSSSATSSSTATNAGTSTGKTITATLTEFHIALSRSTLTPGTYTFVTKNAGHITHALTVNGQGVSDKSTSDLSPGDSAKLTVTLSPGKYEVFCPVGDHKMEGMDTFVQVG